MELAEITSAIEKSPEIKQGIISSLKSDFLKEIEGTHVIRTKEDDVAFLNNHVQLKADELATKKYTEKFGEEYGKALNAIDAKITEISGVEKKPGEKTTEFAARAIAEAKGGGGTAKEVTELQRLLQQSKNESEEKIKSLSTEFFKKEIGWQVNSFLDGASIAIPGHLKNENDRQAYVSQQKNLIKNGFLSAYEAKTDEAGNTVYYKDGQPLMSNKDGKPLTAGDIISQDFGAWFIPKGHQQSGTGTQQGGTPDGGFKSKEDIHAYLAANGLIAGTKEYNDQLEKHLKEGNISL